MSPEDREFVQMLVKALACQRPDCDYEDDSEWKYSDSVRREALKEAKKRGFNTTGE